MAGRRHTRQLKIFNHMKAHHDSLRLQTSALALCALLAAGCKSQPTCCPASVTPTVANTAASLPTCAPEVAAVKPVLKFVSVDSAETAGENGAGANAVDGNPETFWHTQWQDATPECPHEIIIELVPTTTIKGFTYLPRQDDNEHGFIKGYEFFTNDDGKDFGAAAAKGEFDGMKELNSVTFAPKTCRFIKLKALSEISGEAWSSAAEIGVVQ